MGGGTLPKINNDLVIQPKHFLNFPKKYNHLNVYLKKGLVLERDYKIVNEKIWKLF